MLRDGLYIELKMEEESSNRLDTSGNQRDFTDASDAEPESFAHLDRVSGNIGYAVRLHNDDNGQALLERAIDTPLNLQDGFSLEIWAKCYYGDWPEEFAILEFRFDEYSAGWKAIALAYGYNRTGISMEVYATGSDDNSLGPTIDYRNEGGLDSSWRQIVLTFIHGGYMRVYRDSALLGQDNTDSALINGLIDAHFKLRQRVNDIQGQHSAKIDVSLMRIWERELSADEVGQLWNNGNGLEELPPASNPPECLNVSIIGVNPLTQVLTGSGTGQYADQWRVVETSSGRIIASGAGLAANFSFIAAYDTNYQLQFGMSTSGAWSTTGGLFMVPAPGVLPAFWRGGFFGIDSPSIMKMFRYGQLLTDRPGFRVMHILIDHIRSTFRNPRKIDFQKADGAKVVCDEKAKLHQYLIEFPEDDCDASVLELSDSHIRLSER